MTTKSFGLRGAVLGLMLLASLAAALKKTDKTVNRTDHRTMLNGTWIIGKDKTQSTKRKSDDYLPPGLQIQLKLLGPTRLAIDEDRTDELGGEVVLLPPFPEGICSTGLGARVCKNGLILHPGLPATFKAVFSFSRWTHKDAEDAEGSLFVDKGAKAGALFVDISVWEKGLEWSLWIQGRDQLLGAYLVYDSDDPGGEEVPQVWRRSPQPI
jgi:hypothetical protein